MSSLRDDIAHVINLASAENGSDTPDYILADYLIGCIKTFDRAVSAREVWYGRSPSPAHDYEEVLVDGQKAYRPILFGDPYTSDLPFPHDEEDNAVAELESLRSAVVVDKAPPSQVWLDKDRAHMSKGASALSQRIGREVVPDPANPLPEASREKIDFFEGE